MTPLIRCVVFALLMLTSPAMASSAPTGKWRTSGGESIYELSLCDGGLCAKLVWLREDVRTPENLKYLNRFVVRGARQASENEWAGALSYRGEVVDGKLVVTGQNSMQLSGCRLVFCQTVKLSRYNNSSR